jgi:hypothetical protein
MSKLLTPSGLLQGPVYLNHDGYHEALNVITESMPGKAGGLIQVDQGIRQLNLNKMAQGLA